MIPHIANSVFSGKLNLNIKTPAILSKQQYNMQLHMQQSK